MYTVDAHDTVHELATLPQSSVGAPLPMVVSDEHTTLVAYLVELDNPGWDGTTCRVVGPESEAETAAIVRFDAWASMFGPPNDEAFHGHPLESRGLHPYGVFEIRNSSWIRTLERMNSVHQHHDPKRFAELKHFVLSFHDSTFECVAKSMDLVEMHPGSVLSAARRMVELLGSKR